MTIPNNPNYRDITRLYMKGKDEALIWDALNIHFNEETMQPSMAARLKKVNIFFRVITSAVQMYGKHARARIDPEYLQKMINHDTKVNRAVISIIFNELVSRGWSVDVASKGIVSLLDIETQKRKAPLFARQRKEMQAKIAEMEKQEKARKEKEKQRKIREQQADEHNARMKTLQYSNNETQQKDTVNNSRAGRIVRVKVDRGYDDHRF